MRAKKINIIGILKVFVQHNKYGQLSADEQRESHDSGYDYSQLSELESSKNSVALEMEEDSTSLSQATLDEQLEASEKNAPILLSGDLEGKLYLTECIGKEPQVHVYTCTCITEL